MDKMLENEKRIVHIRAYSKNVRGCKRFNADIMISCSIEGEEKIIDLFLTQDQARNFYTELEGRLLQNNSNSKEN